MSSMVVSICTTSRLAGSVRPADEAAQHVGVLGSPRCRRRSRRDRRSSRASAGPGGEGREDDSPGWRDQLGPHAAVHHGKPAQQLGGAGPGTACGRGPSTNPPPTGSAETCTPSAPSRPSPITARSRPRSRRPRRPRGSGPPRHPAVHPGLGLGQPREDPRRRRDHRGREPAGAEHREDVAQPALLCGTARSRSTSVLVARNAPRLTSRARSVKPGTPASQLRAQGLQRTPASTSAPRIHVPRGATRTVEVDHSSHHDQPVTSRLLAADRDALARSEQDEARDEGGAEAYAAYAAGGRKEHNEVTRSSSPTLGDGRPLAADRDASARSEQDEARDEGGAEAYAAYASGAAEERNEVMRSSSPTRGDRRPPRRRP